MPKYGFAVLMFLLNIKDMCLFDISCYVANLENSISESRGGGWGG